MNYEAYIKLEKSINNNELSIYLMGYNGYRLKSADDPNFPMMNDYASMVLALNEYGKNHPDFVGVLKLAIIDCLNLKNAGAAYNIARIIREQVILESHGANYIKFIDSEMLEKLKLLIIDKKEYFENFKYYEGSLYSNGMIGAFEIIKEELYDWLVNNYYNNINNI